VDVAAVALVDVAAVAVALAILHALVVYVKMAAIQVV